MQRSLVIVLDNVRSHHNVGSVFRSSDAFGISHLILAGITPAPPHRDIQKTALGATESVPWTHVDSAIGLIEEYHHKGYTICAVEQTASSQPLPQKIDPTEDKLLLIFGNEVNGVCEELINCSDHTWEIPQKGAKKSLNVSVCAGIVMHHLTC